MYLSGSLGKFFYVGDGNENKINGMVNLKEAMK